MFEHLTRNPLFEHPKPDLGFYPASTLLSSDLNPASQPGNSLRYDETRTGTGPSDSELYL